MKSVLFILAVFFLNGCDRVITVEPVTGKSVPAVAASQTPVPKRVDSELENELRVLVQAVEPEAGVGALHIESGDAVYLNRDGQFPMMSVYKLPIAMAALRLVDERKISLDQEIIVTKEDFVRPGFHSPIRNVNPGGTVMQLNELLRFSISESDGTASDVILDAAGGPHTIQAYLDSIGVGEGIKVVNSEKEISQDWETQYRNWATPEATIELLRRIQTREAKLSEMTTQRLLTLMTDSETGRRRLRAGLPKEAELAHKTGTGGTKDGITGATNDVGIITLPNGRHIAIAVYIKNSKADMWARENLMSKVAELVYRRWSEK
jgi:beta-lactamase class A